MNRIPPYKLDTTTWYKAMRDADLLFHIDDLPEDIINRHTNKPLFNETECLALTAILPWIDSGEFFDAWAADQED
jgi:hypothetical protein